MLSLVLDLKTNELYIMVQNSHYFNLKHLRDLVFRALVVANREGLLVSKGIENFMITNARYLGKMLLKSEPLHNNFNNL